MALDLEWNTQGLGTYAELPCAERDLLPLGDMTKNPHIVHFTGPVNPGMIDVMNPLLQPCTAKPWGFIGAPGNAYADEWWAVQGRTV